ncbi:hypothetical protein ACJZ2D_008259 [Fusarium nematophilum]
MAVDAIVPERACELALLCSPAMALEEPISGGRESPPVGGMPSMHRPRTNSGKWIVPAREADEGIRYWVQAQRELEAPDDEKERHPRRESSATSMDPGKLTGARNPGPGRHHLRVLGIEFRPCPPKLSQAAPAADTEEATMSVGRGELGRWALNQQRRLSAPLTSLSHIRQFVEKSRHERIVISRQPQANGLGAVLSTRQPSHYRDAPESHRRMPRREQMPEDVAIRGGPRRESMQRQPRSFDRPPAYGVVLDQVISHTAKLDRRTSADGPEHGRPVSPHPKDAEKHEKGSSKTRLLPARGACVSSARVGMEKSGPHGVLRG